jgi:hypothetical protein
LTATINPNQHFSPSLKQPRTISKIFQYSCLV